MSMNYYGFFDPPLSFPLGAETQNRVETPDRTRPDNVRARAPMHMSMRTRTKHCRCLLRTLRCGPLWLPSSQCWLQAGAKIQRFRVKGQSHKHVKFALSVGSNLRPHNLFSGITIGIESRPGVPSRGGVGGGGRGGGGGAGGYHFLGCDPAKD